MPDNINIQVQNFPLHELAKQRIKEALQAALLKELTAAGHNVANGVFASGSVRGGVQAKSGLHQGGIQAKPGLHQGGIQAKPGFHQR